MTHTPTPLPETMPLPFGVIDKGGRILIADADTNHVAVVTGETVREGKQAAAFIAAACNSHEANMARIAELEGALRCIDAALNQNKTFPADVELARRECRSVLGHVQST